MKRRAWLAALPALVGGSRLAAAPRTSPGASAPALTITGAGTAEPLVAQLVAAFRHRHPEVRIRVVSPPLGSRASERGLASGLIDIALLGRALRSDEAETARSRPLARTPLLFAAHGAGFAEGLDSERLAAIYEGRLKRWPEGGPIRVVLRSATHTDTALIRAIDPGLDLALGRALSRPGMVFAQDDLECVDLLERTVGSLGATTLALLWARGGRLRAQTWRGVAPTLDTLRHGDYPLARSIHVAIAQHPAPPAQRFLAFVFEPAVQAAFRRLGFEPEVA